MDALARFVRTGAAIDAYLADQLLLPSACVAGRSTLYTEAVTPHLLTNAQVIQTFVRAAIRIDGRVGEPGQVVIDGVGL